MGIHRRWETRVGIGTGGCAWVLTGDGGAAERGCHPGRVRRMAATGRGLTCRRAMSGGLRGSASARAGRAGDLSQALRPRSGVPPGSLRCARPRRRIRCRRPRFWGDESQPSRRPEPSAGPTPACHQQVSATLKGATGCTSTSPATPASASAHLPARTAPRLRHTEPDDDVMRHNSSA